MRTLLFMINVHRAHRMALTTFQYDVAIGDNHPYSSTLTMPAVFACLSYFIFLQSDQDGHNLCDSGTAPLQRCQGASPQLDNLACPSSYTCSCRTHSDMKRY